MGCGDMLLLDLKGKMIYFFCIKFLIVIATFRITSAEIFHSFIQNPGKEVNFYGNIQNNPQGDTTSESDSSSNNTFYQDPGIICNIIKQVRCNFSYPYRQYDGSCNNPRITSLGMKNQCYLRFTPPYYEGRDDFRKSVKGGPLPHPRDISLKIFKDVHRPTVNVSFQFATFGQFIAFDIVHSAHPASDCCSKDKNKPKCKPISIRPDDPFYSKFNKTCMNFRRTEQCDCDTTYRAQKNGATSAIDLSHVYSVSKNTAQELRKLDGTGKLKVNDTSVGVLLPTGKAPGDPFCPKLQESECFIGGDPRLNQHASLTSLVTIFTREHNRIATILKQMNPKWGEEKLFQEARKIVIGEFQSIVFKDYLPLLVTPQKLKEFDMTVESGSNGMLYDSSVILGMWNEFAIGSFRLHSLVPTKIGVKGLRFKDTYSNPDLLREGYLSQLIKGSHQVPSEQFDRYVVTDLTDYLYQMPGMEYGQDIASINIQRGRDHGLAPYVDVVNFCSGGNILISSFDDLHKLGLMSTNNSDLLKEIYASVKDVDMWVGMQLENHMPGAITGPSTVCINIKQFFFHQKGDKFYFDLVGKEAPFKADQRSALKQCSLAQILCDNTKMKRITKNPLLQPGDDNPTVSCNEIPEIDLMPWKDTDTSQS